MAVLGTYRYSYRGAINGSFGSQVYFGSDSSTNLDVAVKLVPVSRYDACCAILREMAVPQALGSHPNILPVLSVIPVQPVAGCQWAPTSNIDPQAFLDRDAYGVAIVTPKLDLALDKYMVSGTHHRTKAQSMLILLQVS